MKRLTVVAVFGLLLGACGGSDLGGEGVASRIEQDFGGPSGLVEFFESHT